MIRFEVYNWNDQILKTTIRSSHSLDGTPAEVKDKPKFVEIYTNPKDAVKDIPSNSTLLVGGFGLCGIPENLINALFEQKVNQLRIISNDAGFHEYGVGVLILSNQV